MHQANAALRRLSQLLALLAAVGVAVTAIVNVAEVIFRYGLNSPLNWAGDIGSYMLCASVLLAVPLISRQRGHISVTVILDLLPARVRPLADRTLDMIVAVVLLIVTWFVLQLCLRHFQQGVLTTMANQIPRWWLSALMTVSFLLAALNFIAPAEPANHDVKDF